MKVAYQGVPGAFAHQACLDFLADHVPLGCATFADVVASVERGEADRGVLPVENSHAGPVTDARDLIEGSDLVVVAERVLPVRMHLLGLPGAKLEDVTTAVSHPIALKQCAATLERLGLTPEPAVNTAVAAQSLADPTKSVLASEAAAKAYGLIILKRDVHDTPDNSTTFAVLARREA
jgi:prephenate dehydratase